MSARLSFTSASNARRGGGARLRKPARSGESEVQRRRPRLLVQGFSAPSKTAGHAAKTKAANDDGLIARRLQSVGLAPDAKQ